MRSGFQQKLPEEIELDQKCVELASLRAQHETARAAFQKVRDEIAQFEKKYDQTLGRRLAELERLEEEIFRLTGYSTGETTYQSQGSDDEDEGETFTAGGRSGSSSEPFTKARMADDGEIKALYREVAKAIHPDLANSGAEQVARHELMAQANRAYAQQDRRALQEILRKWRPAPPVGQEPLDIANELVRVIRLIAQERKDIQALQAKTRELKESYVCRFKLRVDAGLTQGVDLFAEMIAAADLNIARARRRLATLRGDRPRPAAAKTARQRREICFPTDDFSATLYLRDRNSLNFSQWRKVGPARGCLEIDADQAVRLDVKVDSAVKVSQMRNLKPDDLQALFLYEVDDNDLESITHLTGLEELYLSGPGLTDAALSGIASLTNLQRIYLYQTVITDRGLAHLHRFPALKGLTSSGNSITDEGLAIFQKAIPGVKTVSFPWRYSR